MFDDDITPTGVSRGVWHWFPAGVNVAIAVLLLGGLITFVGWQANWWFADQNVNRQYSQTVHSQSFQTSVAAEMQQHLSNITGPGGVAATRASVPANSPEQATLRSQELSELREFCSESAQLTPQDPASDQLEQVANANCLAGAPVASPPLASPVPAGGQ